MALPRAACSVCGKVDYWQHEVVLTHTSWPVRAGNKGLGIQVWGCWGTGRRLADLTVAWVYLFWGILSFHLCPFTPYCRPPLPFSLSVLVNYLLNKFELQNVPNKAYFLLIPSFLPSFRGPRLPSCSVQMYDPFPLSL